MHTITVQRRVLARLFALAALAFVATALAAPQAQAGLQGYGKYAYTKGSTATFWWQWTRVNGLNPDGQTDTRYYVCRDTWENNFKIESSNGTNGPFAQGCTASLTGASGNISFQPRPGQTLPDGARYDMCATQWNLYVYVWSQIGTSACMNTRIDRNKPTVAVSVNGSQVATRDPQLNFYITYGDSTSPPWPANYRCIKIGSPCTGADAFPYDPNCSVLTQGTTNQFHCQANFSTQPDGRVYFCASAADSAVPDNSASPTYPTVNSSNANISDFACGWVILDRTAPSVTVTPSATDVHVGDLVTFNASATDGGSGLQGDYSWIWGDNTAGGTGQNASHTYTQAGTFQVVARISDAAGNVGSATRTITVTNPPTGGGDTGGGGSTGGGDTGGGSTGGGSTGGGDTGGGTTGGDSSGGTTSGGTDGGGTPAPVPVATSPAGTTTGGGTAPTGSGTPTAGGPATGTDVGGTSGGAPKATATGGTLDGPTTNAALVKAAGGRTTAKTYRVGGLRLRATPRVTLGPVPRLPLILTADGASRVTLTLKRGTRTRARASVRFSAKGTRGLRIRLPKAIAAGTYRLTVSYRRDGARRAASRSIGVRLVRRSRASAAGSRGGVPRITGGATHAPGERPAVRRR